MNPRWSDYLYILATIGMTVYGQIILKWRIAGYGSLPSGLWEKLRFLVGLLVDPLIFSGFAAAFIASLAWMAAMTKFDLNHAYPFMSLNFVLVLVMSAWLLHEPVSLFKVLGVLLIVAGTVIGSLG